MPELIRVKDKSTGHHYTIPAAIFDPDRHRKVVSKTDPATDRQGRPREPKFAIPKKRPAQADAEQATQADTTTQAN